VLEHPGNILDRSSHGPANVSVEEERDDARPANGGFKTRVLISGLSKWIGKRGLIKGFEKLVRVRGWN
jgi:hypothetical protein